MAFRHDLVGGPFAVIESDPGVFTTLIRKLGVRGLEVTELYSVEPFETDHLNPYGLIFCFLCEDETDAKHDLGEADALDDPDAREIWFANQLSDNACSSQAILNVLLNCRGVDLGPELRDFAADTEKMSPVMRGLAVSNSSHIREAQNSLARAADIRGAYHILAATALESAKNKAKASGSPPTKKRKTSSTSSHTRRKSTRGTKSETLEAYHYIGYVPAQGRVWELDGLRAAGPLDVGELDNTDPSSRAEWMDIVRPALMRRMQAVLGDGQATGHIQYNLLAIVEDKYLDASDTLEMLKRERASLERRLGERFPEGWESQVDGTLLASASQTFATSLRPSAREPGRVFAADFGARKMAREMAILDMPERKLVCEWETCVRNAIQARVTVEEEIEKARVVQAENVKRTFDYEPFIREFVTCLQDEGLLDDALKEGAIGDAAEARVAAGSASRSKSKKK